MYSRRRGSTKPRQVAVVGAGAAGAATATALADVADVTVFERHAAVGGRTCTRERDDCRYEVGANYLSPTDDAVGALLDDVLPDAERRAPDGAIWTFDASGAITPGDEERNATERRLTTVGGLATLTERILRAADAEVVLETRIDALERADGDWRVRDGRDRDRGTFDAVVLTPPSPLTADLLGRSEWQHPDCRDVREAIESVPYRPIASVVVHYPFELDRPWYALVNDDREHDVGWLAREDRKPGHVPDGESVLLVQCSSDFTVEHFEADPVAIVDAVSDRTADLLDDERLAAPDWSDFQSWRYAVPEAGVDPEPLTSAAEHDLYFAGDWVVGEDRINGALRSGLETGERLRASVS